MIVSPTLPVKNLKRIYRASESRSWKVQLRILGTGTAVHLAEELFKQKAGVDMVHVPYRGTVAAMPDLLSGRIAMMIDGVPVQTETFAMARCARSP